MLAAPLAAGVSPAEMLKSLEGKSTQFSRFRAARRLQPQPARARRAVRRSSRSMCWPSCRARVGDLLRAAAEPGARRCSEPLRDALRNPTPRNLQQLLAPIGEALAKRRGFPSPLDYLPSGFFDNSSIERYLRRNLERGGTPNDFRDAATGVTKKELYIGAMNLDTAERVVFGHDEDTSVTVSEAVQASTALPGFYKPARINGIDYVDGGVRRTANIDVAIEHGADLVICYNPFRPFSNRVRRTSTRTAATRSKGQLLADGGVLIVLNQVFRTLLHSRLQYGLRQYQDDPNFRGDIVVIEPKETDRALLPAQRHGLLAAPARGAVRLHLGHRVDRAELRPDQADPRELRPPHDPPRGARRAWTGSARRASPKRPKCSPAKCHAAACASPETSAASRRRRERWLTTRRSVADVRRLLAGTPSRCGPSSTAAR